MNERNPSIRTRTITETKEQLNVAASQLQALVPVLTDILGHMKSHNERLAEGHRLVEVVRTSLARMYRVNLLIFSMLILVIGYQVIRQEQMLSVTGRMHGELELARGHAEELKQQLSTTTVTMERLAAAMDKAAVTVDKVAEDIPRVVTDERGKLKVEVSLSDAAAEKVAKTHKSNSAPKKAKISLGGGAVQY